MSVARRPDSAVGIVLISSGVSKGTRSEPIHFGSPPNKRGGRQDRQLKGSQLYRIDCFVFSSERKPRPKI